MIHQKYSRLIARSEEKEKLLTFGEYTLAKGVMMKAINHITSKRQNPIQKY